MNALSHPQHRTWAGIMAGCKAEMNEMGSQDERNKIRIWLQKSAKGTKYGEIGEHPSRACNI
jgi:hypothetical protein